MSIFYSTDLPSSHYIEKLLDLRDKLTTIKNRISVDQIGTILELVEALQDSIETGNEYLINQYINSL